MKKITSLFVGLLLVVPSFGQISAGGGGIELINGAWPTKVQLGIFENSRLSIATSGQSQKDLTFPFAITKNPLNNLIITFFGMPATSTVVFSFNYYDSNDKAISNPIETLPSTPGRSDFQLSPIQGNGGAAAKLKVIACVKSQVRTTTGGLGYATRYYSFTYTFK